MWNYLIYITVTKDLYNCGTELADSVNGIDYLYSWVFRLTVSSHKLLADYKTVTSSRWIKDREGSTAQQSKKWGTSVLLTTLVGKGTVVSGMNTHKTNPFQKWDYEQSEHVSETRERGDEVMATQTSYDTLNKLVTACTMIFVSRAGRGSHSNAKEDLWELSVHRAKGKISCSTVPELWW